MENKLNGKISRGEAMEMLRQDGGANEGESDDEEDDLFNVQRDR